MTETHSAHPPAGTVLRTNGLFETVANGFGGTTTRRVSRPATDDPFDTPHEVAKDAQRQARQDPGALPFRTDDRQRHDRPMRGRTPNRYAGNCARCGGHVEAEAGFLGDKVNGKWTVVHGECPATQPTPTTGSFDLFPGRYTLVDGVNGHRTFRVRVQAADADFAPGETILEFLSGPDNDSDYTPFAFVKPGRRLVVWKKFGGRREGQEALLADAKAFLADPEGDGVFVTRQCARCGDDLTVPESIERGLGPYCAKVWRA